MSRKDYEAIAEVLAWARGVYGDKLAREVVAAIAAGLADTFGDDDPRFDRERFLSAARGE